jgi:UDP-glucose 4-epimerase
MNKKKVIVTGGSGFIGSNIVEKLLQKDYEIIVVDNLSSGSIENIESYLDKISFIKEDIKNHDIINSLIDDNVVAIIHLAAMVGVTESIQNPKECYETNVIASINLIEQCIKYDAKFIFASSAAIYGEDKSPIKSEDLKTIPISPYGQSKLDVEVLCDIYNKENNLDYVCFRNFNVYGAKQDPNSAYAAVIPSFITLALQNEDLNVYGDGMQTRDFVHVEDVAQVYLLSIEENINGVYNIGCNLEIQINEVAQIILDKIDTKSNLKYLEPRKGDIKHSRASIEKISSYSLWRPSISLEEGIEKTISYYKDLL